MTSSKPVRAGPSFQRLVAELPVPAFACDAEGKILAFNSRAADLWGREPRLRDSQQRYCAAARLYFEDGTPMPVERSWVAIALQTRRPVLGMEYVVERPDGSRRTVLDNVKPLFDARGELLGALSVMVDVGDRRHALEQFRVATEASPVAKLAVNERGRITLVNAQAETLFGYTRTELLGKPVEMLLPRRYRDRHPGYRAGFLKDATPRSMGAGRDLFGMRKDGSEVPIEIGLNPIHTPDGVLVLIAVVDISERKEAEQALRESEERLRELNQSLEEKVRQRTQELVEHQERLRMLAARLSSSEQEERRRVAVALHDNLAQLLAICKMKLSLARREVPQIESSPDIASVEHALDEALQYTRSLISDLTPPFDFNREDLVEAVKWVADKMAQHGLEVTIDDDGLPKPMGAEFLSTTFESVRELLFNVAQHSGTKAATVRLRRSGDLVTVTVTDRGAGFDVDERRLRSSGGGGLGLFGVRERLAALGAGFAVTSTPGRGTRAVLEVPLGEAQSDAAQDAPAKSNGAEERGRKIRVLLVDDHEMMREGLRRIINLESDLEVVAEAADGEKAVRLARELRPDLIVMDVGMPRLNGVEATRRIVSEDPGARIVALSLNESDEAIAGMLRAGARDYIFKSQAFGSLCAAIRQHSGPLPGENRLGA